MIFHVVGEDLWDFSVLSRPLVVVYLAMHHDHLVTLTVGQHRAKYIWLKTYTLIGTAELINTSVRMRSVDCTAFILYSSKSASNPPENYLKVRWKIHLNKK